MRERTLPRVPAVAAALALLVLLPAAVALADGQLSGKWRMGSDDAAGPKIEIEFSSGGVVIFNDQVGTYWVTGSRVTIDGWNGKQVTLKWSVAGNTLRLTDPDDNVLEFRRVKL